MRRYTITINNTSHVIDVEESSADTFEVRLDGRVIDVRLDDHQDLAQAVIAPELEVGPHTSAAPSKPLPAAPQSSRNAPAAPPPRPAASTAAPTSASGGDGSVHAAPMPGVILSIDVAAGQTVSRGDALLVLEAMKMKNTLFAARDGVVAEVCVAEGQQVKYGEALVRYEEN